MFGIITSLDVYFDLQEFCLDNNNKYPHQRQVFSNNILIYIYFNVYAQLSRRLQRGPPRLKQSLN